MTALELPKPGEWTVEDLADLPADLNYELIEGRLVVPSPTGLHQFLAGELWNAVRANCPQEYFATLDLSLQIDPRNEPRPDVVVIRVEQADRSPVPVVDAILAVEVVSGGSVIRDLFDKSAVYARAGIAHYWMVDVERDDVVLTEMVLDHERGAYRTGRVTSEVFTVRVPWEITVDLPALTRRVRAIRDRAKPRD